MLNVQEFLAEQFEQGKSQIECFNALTEQLSIKVKIYPEDGIVLLDYHMIDSPKTQPIVIECRSLILDLHTFGVISRKFDRFFNYGEALEYYQDFNLPRSVISEKADGSLIGVYYYNGKWNISTRGMAFAEGDHVMGGTFRDKVLDAFGVTDEMFQSVFNNYPKDTTFVFEYTSPENRIVTKYDKPQMVILSANNGENEWDMETLNIAMIKTPLNVRPLKTYYATDMEEVVKLANSLPNLEEGFVIYDPVSFKRMKVKSSLYVVAHALRGEDALPTRKNLLKLFFTGELDEFIAYFPEWEVKAANVKYDVDQALWDLEEAWVANRHIESQKDFALAIKDVKYNGILFQARKQNVSVKDVWDKTPTDRKISMFEKS